ncbi:unnamed protein product [Phaedon cochleariae]|uniref:Spondin domain-containing protein n=1 Tax=Phaedon cochleariae TaxID=80249 RepID=A0A9P0GU68_PHACE|nr:unnamed protein product [Phaedon cochleariae]
MLSAFEKDIALMNKATTFLKPDATYKEAFVETGRSDVLEEQSQGEGGVYDEFNAPPVPTGAGRTEAEFFVDGNHSKVSLMSRIVPSPDWFIGIDSFDLCVNGNWLDSITIEVKEYELSEVFHHSEDDRQYEVLKMDHQNAIDVFNGNNDIQKAIEEEREEQEVHDKSYRQRPRPRPLKSFTFKSCGIGEMQRRREVAKHARRGGRLCPPLVETKWCGSARSCNKEYFNW